MMERWVTMYGGGHDGEEAFIDPEHFQEYRYEIIDSDVRVMSPGSACIPYEPIYATYDIYYIREYCVRGTFFFVGQHSTLSDEELYMLIN